MTTARPTRIPSWTTAVLLVALLPLTLLAPLREPATGTWWPAGGMAAAALLLVPARLVAVMVGGMVGVTTPVIAVVYDAGLVQAVAATSAFVVPALLVATLLRRGARAQHGARLPAGLAGTRYHLVVLASAVLCGLLAGLVALPTAGPTAATQWVVSSTLGGLTAMLIVLPLVAGPGPASATGSTAELWTQRGLVAVTAVTLLLVPAPPALTTVAFPLLAWAALRASRHETHLQVGGLGITLYAGSVLDLGALADPSAGALPDALAAVPLYLFLAALSMLVVPLALASERLSQARTAAVRNEATVQRMLDGVGGTLLIATDDNGRIVHFNQGASRLLEYDAEHVTGLYAGMLHTEAEVARQAAALGVEPLLRAVVARQTELGERRDWEFVRADGEARTVSLSFNVVRDPEDEVAVIVASGEDVTERLRAQHALEAALDREQRAVLRLQEVDHVKQELVSNVSHELRTPITSIAGYAELLADDSLGELTRAQRDALERIERNAHRLQALVDDLLTMSRAEAGRLQLCRVPVDLVEVVRGAWELFDEQLRHRELAATVVLPSEPVPVLGDARALERVVVNLVGNSVKFTPDRGAVTVALSRTTQGGARLVVRDTGIGIPVEDQAKLFTRFFRSRQVTDQAIQGSGLGLSIVQTLVAQHGGQVTVRSRPGEGTRVTVELPSP